MASIPRYEPSSIPDPAAELIGRLAGPLLDRCGRGRPSLGLAYYDGDRLDPRWPQAVADWAKARGVFVEHVTLDSLGEVPVEKLLHRNRVGEHLFSIEIAPDNLPDAALRQPTHVADLNIHRDTFRDNNLNLLLWIPGVSVQRFMELASNLVDYRTVDLDIPPFPATAGSAQPQQQPAAAGAARHNLPLASLGGDFLGRDDELAELHRLLDERGQGAICDALSLEGLGGIGKTRLALEYAWRHMSDYRQILFVRADTPQTLMSELAGLPDDPALGIPPTEETAEDARLQFVLDWFGDHDGWLLIVDNADAEDSADYIADRLLPRLGRGHVLLTTRFRRWGGRVRAVPLPPMPEDEAVELLIKATRGRRPTADDAETAARLADAVGRLPLALEQIAAWVRSRQATLQEALTAVIGPP